MRFRKGGRSGTRSENAGVRGRGGARQADQTVALTRPHRCGQRRESQYRLLDNDMQAVSPVHVSAREGATDRRWRSPRRAAALEPEAPRSGNRPRRAARHVEAAVGQTGDRVDDICFGEPGRHRVEEAFCVLGPVDHRIHAGELGRLSARSAPPSSPRATCPMWRRSAPGPEE